MFDVDRHAAQVGSEVELFALAAHYADLNGECHRDADGRVLPGTETTRQLGGLGTPRVNEFAPAEFGAVQAMHPIAAEHLIADAGAPPTDNSASNSSTPSPANTPANPSTHPPSAPSPS